MEQLQQAALSSFLPMQDASLVLPRVTVLEPEPEMLHRLGCNRFAAAMQDYARQMTLELLTGQDRSASIGLDSSSIKKAPNPMDDYYYYYDDDYSYAEAQEGQDYNQRGEAGAIISAGPARLGGLARPSRAGGWADRAQAQAMPDQRGQRDDARYEALSEGVAEQLMGLLDEAFAAVVGGVGDSEARTIFSSVSDPDPDPDPSSGRMLPLFFSSRSADAADASNSIAGASASSARAASASSARAASSSGSAAYVRGYPGSSSSSSSHFDTLLRLGGAADEDDDVYSFLPGSHPAHGYLVEDYYEDEYEGGGEEQGGGASAIAMELQGGFYDYDRIAAQMDAVLAELEAEFLDWQREDAPATAAASRASSSRTADGAGGAVSSTVSRLIHMRPMLELSTNEAGEVTGAGELDAGDSQDAVVHAQARGASVSSVQDGGEDGLTLTLSGMLHGASAMDWLVGNLIVQQLPEQDQKRGAMAGLQGATPQYEMRNDDDATTTTLLVLAEEGPYERAYGQQQGQGPSPFFGLLFGLPFPLPLLLGGADMPQRDPQGRYSRDDPAFHPAHPGGARPLPGGPFQGGPPHPPGPGAHFDWHPLRPDGSPNWCVVLLALMATATAAVAVGLVAAALQLRGSMRACRDGGRGRRCPYACRSSDDSGAGEMFLSPLLQEEVHGANELYDMQQYMGVPQYSPPAQQQGVVSAAQFAMGPSMDVAKALRG